MAYKGRSFIRERAYYCGDRLEIDIYTVWQSKGKRRKKCKPTREVQEKLNERNSEQHMLRVALLNFEDRKDIALHLTYREGCEPATDEEVARDFRNFVRRVRRLRKKLGLPPMRYMWRIHRGKEGGRLHIHVMMTGGMDRDLLEELWGLGYGNSKRLQFEDGTIAALTKYMGGQEKITYRRWNGSRNLIQPEPVEQDGRLTVENVQVLAEAVDGKVAALMFEEIFPGYELDFAEAEPNEVNRQVYIRVSMKRKTDKKAAPVPRRAGAIAAFLKGGEQ